MKRKKPNFSLAATTTKRGVDRDSGTESDRRIACVRNANKVSLPTDVSTVSGKSTFFASRLN